MTPGLATLILVACVVVSWSRMQDQGGNFPIPDFVRGCFYPLILLIVYLVFLVIYFAAT